MNHRMLRMPAGWEWHLLTDGRVPAEWLSATSGAKRPGPAPAGAGQPHPAEHLPKDAPIGGGAAEAGAPGSVEATETEGTVPLAGMTRSAALTAVKRRLPECANWLDDAVERRDTRVVMTETPEAGDTVFGTLPLRMSPDERDVCPLHFWLTEKRLVTLQFDLRFMLRLQRSPWEERIGRAGSAPEAFAVILTAALETLRAGFEAFERRLDAAEAEYAGRPIPAGTIAGMQRELLQWNRHLLALVEADSAAAEAFGSRLTDSEAYRRLQRRLGLVRALIGRHAAAIETLAALDGAVAAPKGAPPRALALAALLPVPAAAAGAFWGLRAGGAAIADEPWGFAAVCGGAALLSLALYAWLRRLVRPAGADRRNGARPGRDGGRRAGLRDGAFPDEPGGMSGPRIGPEAGAAAPSRSKRARRR
ncbi:MAG: hypothetical protein A9Z00_08085 [Thermobacillus sp. ZCTH02-B1]|uniref:CorA family divalent cation transporter n=1 Tax=Thermobacillus sp. ZCTH02-B1 TaxID=1858795 RepID=UPI000B56D3E5|nr:CorA family divalent cation transporter [Thermobacillus sp. ZCTH02-B1]OUM95314.1 MAG: hypothetical protein A9Z00_08085 [Thermobacillus sp. ZCTH02-B1]